MVSPCKTVHAKSRNEATKAFKLLEKHVFYLDIKNSAVSKLIEEKIKKFGGRVEVFLVGSVTHVVSDGAPCLPPPPPAAPATNSPAPQTWGGRRRADAMLERAALLQPPSHSTAPYPPVPVWSLQKVKDFLSRICIIAYKKLQTEQKVLKEPFIKFEAADRKSRAVYKELSAWPELRLRGEHSGSPFMSPGEARGNKGPGKAKQPIGTLSSASKKRMTRKTKPRMAKDQADIPQKQSGYCEICRVEYSHLAEHERSVSHLNFVKNCSNFLSLDSLISASADVEAFLKMNKSVPVSNSSFERRSLRNIVKLHPEVDGPQDPRKQLEVICNGAEPHSPHPPHMSPALGETGHYLRSKGATPLEQDYPAKLSPGEGLPNGSASPRAPHATGRPNGRLEGEGKRPRSIRWRRPSPEGAPPVLDTQAYYRVVGMSTKLRSSATFTPAPPPARPTCNGDDNPGLVVKFRRVRRSELSVLSDEAENFMFPKKDDSDTEDELETTASSRKGSSSEPVTESRVKEETLSVDEDSCESIRTPVESYKGSPEPEVPARLRRCTSRSPEPAVESVEGARCLKWQEGRLRASAEVERLTYTFEQVPRSEPWYHTFQRQDEGKENTKSIIQYLDYFSKSLVLPYEMSELPPLKPNCCALSQVKKPSEIRSGPPRLYGTRGMKKKKIKQDPVFTLGLNPRKSPREHASTLAILGGLIHRKRSKFSCSDDSKSLPSIAEEDVSSDATPLASGAARDPIAEATKQLEALFSSVYDDEDGFDVPMESIDCGVNMDRTSVRPNVIELLQNYQQCETLENTVQEMHDNIQPEPPKRRKGYKFKKKNKTGWPNKKKVKRDTASTVGSTCSSREPSSQRGLSPCPESRDSAVPAVLEDCVQIVKDNFQVELNESSITWSDAECKGSDAECDVSEEEPSPSRWECSVKEARELQPVVRVQKMEAKLERRLRSADVNRRLRTRRRPHR